MTKSRILKLLHYSRKGIVRAGVIHDQQIYDLQELASAAGIVQLKHISTIDEILSNDLLTTIKGITKWHEKVEAMPLTSVALKSPILSPQKIFLSAVNYKSHGEEQRVMPPSEPYFFTKFRNSIIGPNEPILIPRVSKKVDWEVELAVIIGKRGKYIPMRSAMEYVAGYTISNDISFRDLQFPDGWPSKLNPLGQNWVKGKGLDASFSLGPWFVTTDEMADPYSSNISLRVNGIERQRSVISEMIFKIDYMIEYLSNGITLEPGDIISTGTPLGVAAFSGMPYLKEGDVVEASINTIGTLRNPVIAES
jgi:2-keto-4-pentenoate hydratase/2-oxohepta-3-ene-1,7-dioic acid hydratase in catechol pathway